MNKASSLRADHSSKQHWSILEDKYVYLYILYFNVLEIRRNQQGMSMLQVWWQKLY